jgi:hypothetical protein
VVRAAGAVTQARGVLVEDRVGVMAAQQVRAVDQVEDRVAVVLPVRPVAVAALVDHQVAAPAVLMVAVAEALLPDACLPTEEGGEAAVPETPHLHSSSQPDWLPHRRTGPAAAVSARGGISALKVLDGRKIGCGMRKNLRAVAGHVIGSGRWLIIKRNGEHGRSRPSHFC